MRFCARIFPCGISQGNFHNTAWVEERGKYVHSLFGVGKGVKLWERGLGEVFCLYGMPQLCVNDS